MRTLDVVTAAAIGAVILFSSRPAAAQFGVMDRIKKDAAEKVAARKRQADSAVVARAGKAVDSTLEKTGRGVDTAVAKVGTVADTAINRSERGVKSLAGRRPDAGARLAADLADDGRVILDSLRFTASGALEPSSREQLRALAALIAQASGPFLVEGHVAPAGGAAAEQARSEGRAKAVKAALADEGVDASRLFVMALGASRPPADRAHQADRIEISRMQ